MSILTFFCKLTKEASDVILTQRRFVAWIRLGFFFLLFLHDRGSVERHLQFFYTMCKIAAQSKRTFAKGDKFCTQGGFKERLFATRFDFCN